MKHLLMKYINKNPKKIESSALEPDKHLQIEGHMSSCRVPYSNLKGDPDVIDTELEEEFNKIESSANVKVSYGNLFHVYSIHEDELKALGCTRLLSIFHKMTGEDFLNFIEMFGVNSPDLLPDGTFPE
jgi:hypothetical protein